MKNCFYKAHGLGNDYIVVDPQELDFKLAPQNIRLICDRHLGVGSDGILVLKKSAKADFALQIFNPDGSEAEKSGNGIRIFARYLISTNRTDKHKFRVETKGGIVKVELIKSKTRISKNIKVVMGKATFAKDLNAPITIDGKRYNFTEINVGNPHAVFFKPTKKLWSRKELLKLGPLVEKHKHFPNRTNVQLATPTGLHEVTILIWERGAGETQASGSSACAVAAAGVKLGLVKSPVTVKAPGGNLKIDVDSKFSIIMEGPVEEVASGQFCPDLLSILST